MTSVGTHRPGEAAVTLYWLPLGAGGHFVRWNGRVYEALAARRAHRAACALYHSALEVRVAHQRYVVEMTPVWVSSVPVRGVVREGPVGSRRLGWSRAFRYEVRRWLEGLIPDIDEAVGSCEVGNDPVRARRLLQLVPRVPALTWGRDELGVGDMWNSNSLISWLLARSGHETSEIAPPGRGRAPGWYAGLALAESQARETSFPVLADDLSPTAP